MDFSYQPSIYAYSFSHSFEANCYLNASNTYHSPMVDCNQMLSKASEDINYSNYEHYFQVT